MRTKYLIATLTSLIAIVMFATWSMDRQRLDIESGLASKVRGFRPSDPAKMREFKSNESAPRDRIPTYPMATRIGVTVDEAQPNVIRLCQAPPTQWPGAHRFAAPHGRGDWQTDFDQFATGGAEANGPGEYSMPGRTKHVNTYRIRVGDELEFVFRRKRETSLHPYRLNVGDTIRVESLTEEKLDRQIVIQPDGFITLPPFKQIGQVRAAGRTIKELTEDLEQRYKKLYVMPSITVTPIKIETRLQDLLDSVDSRFGSGGLRESASVTPEGTVQLPGIGSIQVNGMTIMEMQGEIEARYDELVVGLGINAKVTQPAARFVYVAGEVVTPNRYQIDTPTTVSMAIWMAG